MSSPSYPKRRSERIAEWGILLFQLGDRSDAEVIIAQSMPEMGQMDDLWLGKYEAAMSRYIKNAKPGLLRRIHEREGTLREGNRPDENRSEDKETDEG